MYIHKLTLSFAIFCLVACTNGANTDQSRGGVPTEQAVKATMAPPSTGPNIVPDSFTATAKQIKKLQERKEAVQFFEGLFLRDPYILLGPDGYYYYTGTRLGRIKGGTEDWGTEGIEIWKSPDLLNWQLLGVPFRFADLSWKDHLAERGEEMNRKPMMWAPEIHYINDLWILTHTTSVRRANLLLADNPAGPYREPFPNASFGHQHDPTLFQDDDGTVYLLSRFNRIQQLSSDLSSFAGEPFTVQPANRKMGHEGLTMMKIGKKYIIFGTAWSTDRMRNGTYNMYYATADNIRGPYSDRRFLGRFLGHGTPFIDKKGSWWVTAFKNGKYISHAEIKNKEVQDDKAYTPMQSGFMLVPIEPIVDQSGDVRFNVLDTRYKYPGPEEAQDFSKAF